MVAIGVFLAHAIRLEAEAARRFDELAELMAACGSQAVAALFHRHAACSRRHSAQAMACAGLRGIEELPPGGYDWPDGEPPEAAPWRGADEPADEDRALVLALAGERRGLAYYLGVAQSATDPRVVAMAGEFAVEGEEHVLQLEQMIRMRTGA